MYLYIHTLHINLPLASAEGLLLSIPITLQADFCLSFTFDTHDIDLESLLLPSECFINFNFSVSPSVFCKSGRFVHIGLSLINYKYKHNKIY